MTAIREQIHARIKTVCEAIDMPGLEVERNRHDPAVRSRTLVIHDGPHDRGDYQETGLDHFTARPLLIGLVRTADGSDPAPILADLYVKVVKALFTDFNSAATGALNSFAIDVREGSYQPVIDPEGSRDRIGQFTLEVEVDFQTAEGRPDQVAD